MALISILLSLHVILFVAYFLYKRYNPQAVLLVSGVAMLMLAYPLGNTLLFESYSGVIMVDTFAFIKDAFSKNMAGVGLMIMVIGGFVAYLQKIGANNALVYISLQPFSILKKYPYFASIMVIPIGQLLFISIPSATGLVLLLVVSILPILVGLGISRLSAVSVITACTVFDMGPGSSNTSKASELIGKNSMAYFVDNQLPFIIPLTVIMMVFLFFSNRYFDKKSGHIPIPTHQEEIKVHVPLIYAIFPVLPLLILLIFSSAFTVFPPSAKIDITTAIFITLALAIAFEVVRTRNLKLSLANTLVFWQGMGNLFVTVITLIVASEVFAKGLIGIGFISSLTNLVLNLGLQAGGLGIILTVIIFTASVLTGSGSASFQSFAPSAFSALFTAGLNSVSAILPLQMASSMGRAISPISGVVIASSQIAQVSPFDLAKRNAIPLALLLIIMILFGSAF